MRCGVRFARLSWLQVLVANYLQKTN